MTEYEKWEVKQKLFSSPVSPEATCAEAAWNAALDAALDAVTMKVNKTASGVPRQEIVRVINELRTEV